MYTGFRSRHNRERGSTKKIDGRDFTASYHGNTGGRREGNDRVDAENEGRRIVEISETYVTQNAGGGGVRSRPFIILHALLLTRT